MRITEWENYPDDTMPRCEDDQHTNMEVYLTAPADTYKNIPKHGVYELRRCARCSCIQQRYMIPEGDADVRKLRAQLAEFSSSGEVSKDPAVKEKDRPKRGDFKPRRGRAGRMRF